MGLPLTCGQSMKIETLTNFTSVEFVAYPGGGGGGGGGGGRGTQVQRGAAP